MQLDEEFIEIPTEDYQRFQTCLTEYLDCRGMISEADFLDRHEQKKLKKMTNKKFFKKADVISKLDELENQRSVQEIKHAKSELKQANRVGSLAWWRNKSKDGETLAQAEISAPEQQKMIGLAEENENESA